MPIEFKETVEIRPMGPWLDAAPRLESLLLKNLPPGDSENVRWRLKDNTDTSARGGSVAEVLGEFREHGLEAVILSGIWEARPFSDAKDGPKIWVYYWLDKGKLEIDIEGFDRAAVDAAKAACHRVKLLLEKREQPEAGLIRALRVHDTRVTIAAEQTPTQNDAIAPLANETATAPQPQAFRSWLKDRWKDHMATFIVTLGATVAAAVVLLWLNVG